MICTAEQSVKLPRLSGRQATLAAGSAVVDTPDITRAVTVIVALGPVTGHDKVVAVAATPEGRVAGAEIVVQVPALTSVKVGLRKSSIVAGLGRLVTLIWKLTLAPGGTVALVALGVGGAPFTEVMSFWIVGLLGGV